MGIFIEWLIHYADAIYSPAYDDANPDFLFLFRIIDIPVILSVPACFSDGHDQPDDYFSDYEQRSGVG